MAQITIIGKNLARQDEEFVFLGPQTDCKKCKLKNICFNLKKNHSYRIITVRDKNHSCTIHEGNAIVVEVEELPIETAIDKKYTKGSAISVEKNNCSDESCPYYELCANDALQPGKKYSILNVLETIPCSKNKSLKRVILSE